MIDKFISITRKLNETFETKLDKLTKNHYKFKNNSKSIRSEIFKLENEINQFQIDLKSEEILMDSLNKLTIYRSKSGHYVTAQTECDNNLGIVQQNEKENCYQTSKSSIRLMMNQPENNQSELLKSKINHSQYDSKFSINRKNNESCEKSQQEESKEDNLDSLFKEARKLISVLVKHGKIDGILKGSNDINSQILTHIIKNEQISIDNNKNFSQLQKKQTNNEIQKENNNTSQIHDQSSEIIIKNQYHSENLKKGKTSTDNSFKCDFREEENKERSVFYNPPKKKENPIITTKAENSTKLKENSIPLERNNKIEDKIDGSMQSDKSQNIDNNEEIIEEENSRDNHQITEGYVIEDNNIYQDEENEPIPIARSNQNEEKIKKEEVAINNQYLNEYKKNKLNENEVHKIENKNEKQKIATETPHQNKNIKEKTKSVERKNEKSLKTENRNSRVIKREESKETKKVPIKAVNRPSKSKEKKTVQSKESETTKIDQKSASKPKYIPKKEITQTKLVSGGSKNFTSDKKTEKKPEQQRQRTESKKKVILREKSNDKKEFTKKTSTNHTPQNKFKRNNTSNTNIQPKQNVISDKKIEQKVNFQQNQIINELQKNVREAPNKEVSVLTRNLDFSEIQNKNSSMINQTNQEEDKSLGENILDENQEEKENIEKESNNNEQEQLNEELNESIDEAKENLQISENEQKEENNEVEESKEQINPIIKSLIFVISKEYLDITETFKLASISKEINNYFQQNLKTALLSKKVSEYEKKAAEIEQNLKQFPSDILENLSFKEFTPSKTAIKSLNFVTKEDENHLSKTDSPEEIYNLFKIIAIILDIEEETEPKNQIVKIIINESLPSFNIDNLKNLMNYLSQNLKLTTKKVEKLIKLNDTYPKLFSFIDIMKYSKACSYITFILKEIYAFATVKASNGFPIYKIRDMKEKLELYTKKAEALKNKLNE